MTIPLRTRDPDRRAVDRRAFLAGAMALPLLPQGPGAATRPGKLGLQDVLDRAHALVREHVDGRPEGDEAWVHAATAVLARLDAVPADPFAAMSDRERAFLGEHTWTFRRIASAGGERPIDADIDADPDTARAVVLTHQIHVAPGGAIPLHDHRDFFGAIVCADGEVEIRSFDLAQGSRDTDEVTVRETSRVWLRPGRFSLLTRTRDNVHEFRAGPQGARVLDLFVWLDRAAHSRTLDWIDDPASQPKDRCYRARWQ